MSVEQKWWLLEKCPVVQLSKAAFCGPREESEVFLSRELHVVTTESASRSSFDAEA